MENKKPTNRKISPRNFSASSAYSSTSRLAGQASLHLVFRQLRLTFQHCLPLTLLDLRQSQSYLYNMRVGLGKGVFALRLAFGILVFDNFRKNACKFTLAEPAQARACIELKAVKSTM